MKKMDTEQELFESWFYDREKKTLSENEIKQLFKFKNSDDYDRNSHKWFFTPLVKRQDLGDCLRSFEPFFKVMIIDINDEDDDIKITTLDNISYDNNNRIITDCINDPDHRIYINILKAYIKSKMNLESPVLDMSKFTCCTLVDSRDKPFKCIHITDISQKRFFSKEKLITELLTLLNGLGITVYSKGKKYSSSDAYKFMKENFEENDYQLLENISNKQSDLIKNKFPDTFDSKYDNYPIVSSSNDRWIIVGYNDIIPKDLSENNCEFYIVDKSKKRI